MPQIIDLGKIRFTFQGVWSASASYEMNDVVKYGGSSYVYVGTSASTGNNPTNTTYWSQMTDGFQWENTYSASTQYQKNDIVLYGPQTYLALQDTIGNTPENPTYWKIFTGGLAFKGNWASASAYYPGDVILRGATGYVADEYHISNASFTTDYNAGRWTLFSKGVRSRGLWTVTTVYLKDDLVTDGVSTYISIDDHTSGNGLFSAESAHWTMFAQGADYLPSQLGNGTKILTTDGTDPLWTDSLNLQGSVLIDSDNSFKVGESSITLAGNTSHDLTDAMAVFSTDTAGGNSEAFAQLAIINGNSDGYGSTDLIIYPNDGTNSSGWIDMGITGPNFDSQTYGITGPHDGYIFVVAPEGSTGSGNLVLATGDTGSENRIVFAAGGLTSGKEQMIIIPDTQVHIEIDTESVSPSTGALRVAGGVGIQGNLNVAGNQNLVGNMIIEGSISVAGGQFVTENLSSTDPLLFVGDKNDGNSVDLGFMTESKLPSASARFIFGNKAVSASVATLNTATYTVTSRAIASEVAELTIGPHSLLVGDSVRISGVSAAWNGDFVVTQITGTTIKYAVPGQSNVTTQSSSGTVQFFISSIGDNGTLKVGDIVSLSGAGSGLDGTRTLTFVSDTIIRFAFNASNLASTAISPAAVAIRSTRTKFSGLVKDNADGSWRLFSNLEARPTTSVNFTLPEIYLDDFYVGEVFANRGLNNFASTSERSLKVPNPTRGTIAFMSDKLVQQFYTGSRWETVDPVNPLLFLGV